LVPINAVADEATDVPVTEEKRLKIIVDRRAV